MLLLRESIQFLLVPWVVGFWSRLQIRVWSGPWFRYENKAYCVLSKTTRWVLFEFVCKKPLSALDLGHFILKNRIIPTELFLREHGMYSDVSNYARTNLCSFFIYIWNVQLIVHCAHIGLIHFCLLFYLKGE
jgi:hypothetical protein